MSLDEDINHFFREGYVILKDCISSKECERFYNETIIPTLQEKFQIDVHDPNTWKLSNTLPYVTYPLPSFNEDDTSNSVTAHGHTDDDNNTECIPYGVMLRTIIPRTQENPLGWEDPITCAPDKQWPSFFQSSKLLSFLNKLHNGNHNWQWLHDDNIGWIHLRFPTQQYNNTKTSSSSTTIDTTSYKEEEEEQDYSQFINCNFHIDGGHFNPHYLHSKEQSVIVLPMIRDVDKGGGNTVIIPKSHEFMIEKFKERIQSSKISNDNNNNKDGKIEGISQEELSLLCSQMVSQIMNQNSNVSILDADNDYNHNHNHNPSQNEQTDPNENNIHKMNKSLGDEQGSSNEKQDIYNYSKDKETKYTILEAAPCNAGDILVLHPFVMHAASNAKLGHPVRITFNMGTKWNQSYPYLSCLAAGGGSDTENQMEDISLLEKHILNHF